MSIQHISAVLDARDERLSGSRKLVLVTLANRTDAQGRCWPSQDLLAEECGISVRAISDHLKALEDDGFILRSTRHLGRGNGSRTIYTLRLEKLAANAPEEIAPAEIAPAKIVECTGSRLRVTNRQEPSITVDTDVSTVSAPKIFKTSKPSSGEARGSRLSEDWRLPFDWLQDAADIAAKASQPLSQQEIDREADKFRDFWCGKPGAAGRKTDWRATWRNWVRSYLDRRPARHAPGRPGPIANGQHGGGSIADAAMRRAMQRQNGNGFPDDGRGHDLPAAPYRLDSHHRGVG